LAGAIQPSFLLVVAIFMYVFHWLFFAQRKPSSLRLAYLFILFLFKYTNILFNHSNKQLGSAENLYCTLKPAELHDRGRGKCLHWLETTLNYLNLYNAKVVHFKNSM
jgi:hypothetical protein